MTISHMKALAVLIAEYSGSSTPHDLAVVANAKALVMGLEKLEKELLKMQEEFGDMAVSDTRDQWVWSSVNDRFETILQGETNDLPRS